jgi:hypothetical protein
VTQFSDTEDRREAVFFFCADHVADVMSVIGTSLHFAAAKADGRY